MEYDVVKMFFIYILALILILFSEEVASFVEACLHFNVWLPFRFFYPATNKRGSAFDVFLACTYHFVSLRPSARPSVINHILVSIG